MKGLAEIANLGFSHNDIKEKNIRGKEAMNAEVVKNSKETRQALLNRGIKPELIKPEEDLKAIEARRKKEVKKIGGNDKKMIE